MKITIITPHYDDFKGIKQTHKCLLKQNSIQWEWIIVDDFSDILIKDTLQDYFDKHDCSNINLIFNNSKTNGSVCRNIGIDSAKNENLVFLDSDDIISESFVRNRLIEVNEFVIFRNSNVLYKNGDIQPFPFSDYTGDFLNYFLQAKLVWPITAILWNKRFLIKIGKFNPNFKRLQDVELSIRALFLGINYQVNDINANFFYCIKPADIKKRPVKVICESVNQLITIIYDNYSIDLDQQNLIKGYYFVCIRYLYKSKLKKDIIYVKNSLKLFYKKDYISFYSYCSGLLFLKLFKFNLIPHELFLRLNRYYFK